jgi:hypothetical protein
MSINFASPNQELALPRAEAAGHRAHTPVQAFYLDRLTKLVHKIHLHGRYLAASDRRMQLLNRAILATYRTCRDLGVEAEARSTLAGLRRELVLPAPTSTEVPMAATTSPPADAASGTCAPGQAGQVHLESQPS